MKPTITKFRELLLLGSKAVLITSGNIPVFMKVCEDLSPTGELCEACEKELQTASAKAAEDGLRIERVTGLAENAANCIPGLDDPRCADWITFFEKELVTGKVEPFHRWLVEKCCYEHTLPMINRREAVEQLFRDQTNKVYDFMQGAGCGVYTRQRANQTAIGILLAHGACYEDLNYLITTYEIKLEPASEELKNFVLEVKGEDE